jgi:hypothetical protein
MAKLYGDGGFPRTKCGLTAQIGAPCIAANFAEGYGREPDRFFNSRVSRKAR